VLVGWVEDHLEVTARGDFKARAANALAVARVSKDIAHEQPRQFECVVNVRTARAPGLTIPSAVQVQMTDAIN